MSLSWQETKSLNPLEAVEGDKAEHVVVYADYDGRLDNLICGAVEECVEKAVTLLEKNVFDNSMFLLFKWDAVHSILTIVVTDESKKKNSAWIVRCCMSGLEKEMSSLQDESREKWQITAEEYESRVKYWIKDYLTTCLVFLRYSLLAAFYSEMREGHELL